MARGRRGTGSAAPAPASDENATGAAPAANGNGPAKAYRHKGEKRRNIPPAAIAAEGRVPAAPKLQYRYSPRLDPVLRFDSTGVPDKLPELLEKAKREPLTDAEARVLAEALRQHDPWLEHLVLHLRFNIVLPLCVGHIEHLRPKRAAFDAKAAVLDALACAHDLNAASFSTRACPSLVSSPR
jgi:hypothetical protein